MEHKKPLVEKDGSMRCPECKKMLGKRSKDDKVDIQVSKGKGKALSYRVRDGSVSVKCLCGTLCFLTKKAVFPIKGL